jgi:ABC-2 type transport system ATP-binding protein
VDQPFPARPDLAVLRSPGSGVSTHGLTKRFGQKVAVNSLDIDVPLGSFFGLVGPNGAGKTTTLRMLTGLLRPDAGNAWIEGIDVWRDPVAAKRVIGVVPDELRLFDRLTGAELLTYNGLLRGMPPEVVDRRTAELLEVLGLDEARDTLVIDFSHGMRKKIALAAALLHAPHVLFLDEPFEGIDPISARTIRVVLERHVRAGATVMFSSHVMEIVERLCDRVGVMHEGRLVTEGPIDQVRAGRSLEERFAELIGAVSIREGALGWLDSSSG